MTVGAYAATKGWKIASTEIFLLSFFGATWESNYPINDRHSVSRLFEPCVGRFVSTYIDHIEAITTGTYSSELQGPVSVDRSETIFDLVDPTRKEPWPDIQFNENGATFVTAESRS